MLHNWKNLGDYETSDICSVYNTLRTATLYQCVDCKLFSTTKDSTLEYPINEYECKGKVNGSN